jgi:hypothetical protein
MAGLILIRSLTLSTDIARTGLPEVVVASYIRAEGGMVEIALSHLRKNRGL